jgi:hypothetical protein
VKETKSLPSITRTLFVREAIIAPQLPARSYKPHAP